MSLSMGMSLGMKQTLSQSLTQRMEMTQQVGVGISSLRDESSFSPAETYSAMVRYLVLTLLKTIQPSEPADVGLSDETQQYLSLVAHILDKDDVLSLKKFAIEHPKAIASLTEEKVEVLVVERIFQHYKLYGGYSIDDKPSRATESDFILAVQNPHEVERKIETEMKVLEQVKENAGAAFMDEINRKRDSLIMANELREEIALFTQIITNALSVVNTTNESIYIQFIRDLVVLDRLTFIQSNRLLKRFTARFKEVRKKDEAKNTEEAMLNFIGEYVLMSMGIISSEIFQLKTATFDAGLLDEVRAEFKEEDVDYMQHIENAGASTGNRIWWHRYKTLDIRPGAKTDEKVRTFIVGAIRLQREKLLGAIDYPALFEAAKGVIFKDEQDDEWRENELRDLFIVHTSRKEFKEAVIKLIRRDWYKEIMSMT